MTYIYEKLDVWQKALQFAIQTMETISSISGSGHQLQVLQKTSASAGSIAATIAKGKSFSSKHDFAGHLYQARGSLYETTTLLELLKRQRLLSEEKFANFDQRANQLAAMLTALIKSIYAPKTDHSTTEWNARDSSAR